MGRLKLQPLGDACLNERCLSDERMLQAPADDEALQGVLAVLTQHDLAAKFTEAICASIDYVLDGTRTGRYDLLSRDVHPGERASVGAKLEYEIQRVFKWKKTRPLDIEVAGVPVDLKTTVGDNWAIPEEAHCHLCICTRIRLRDNTHQSWLIRTHRSWLYRGKGNKDSKRGIAADARQQWGVPLYGVAKLPVNPLTHLTEAQAEEVFDPRKGLTARLLKLFTYLPNTVINRSTILTVGAGLDDPMRRVRDTKPLVSQQGLVLLCGTWHEHRTAAKEHGFDLGQEEWLALSK